MDAAAKESHFRQTPEDMSLSHCTPKKAKEITQAKPVLPIRNRPIVMELIQGLWLMKWVPMRIVIHFPTCAFTPERLGSSRRVAKFKCTVERWEEAIELFEEGPA